MSTAIDMTPQLRQAEIDICLDGDYFSALIDFDYTPAVDAFDIHKVLFNVTNCFWAVLEPEHHALIEKQLRAALDDEK